MGALAASEPLQKVIAAVLGRASEIESRLSALVRLTSGVTDIRFQAHCSRPPAGTGFSRYVPFKLCAWRCCGMQPRRPAHITAR
jgi:hypothetical protein